MLLSPFSHYSFSPTSQFFFLIMKTSKGISKAITIAFIIIANYSYIIAIYEHQNAYNEN